MPLMLQNKITPEWWQDEKSEDAARYKLRPLTGMEFLEVSPHMFIDEAGFINYGGKAMQVLIRYGLIDWDGHTDPDTGESLEFSAEAVKRLPPFRLRQIAYQIANRTQLTEGERKN